MLATTRNVADHKPKGRGDAPVLGASSDILSLLEISEKGLQTDNYTSIRSGPED